MTRRASGEDLGGRAAVRHGRGSGAAVTATPPSPAKPVERGPGSVAWSKLAPADHLGRTPTLSPARWRGNSPAGAGSYRGFSPPFGVRATGRFRPQVNPLPSKGGDVCVGRRWGASVVVTGPRCGVDRQPCPPGVRLREGCAWRCKRERSRRESSLRRRAPCAGTRPARTPSR